VSSLQSFIPLPLGITAFFLWIFSYFVHKSSLQLNFLSIIDIFQSYSDAKIVYFAYFDKKIM